MLATGKAFAMNIQEQLSTFDSWLTGRIEEAHEARKDLAFRDLAPAVGVVATTWEYNLLEPGQRSPSGDGWSVYRLQGVWPEFAGSEPQEPSPRRAAGPEKRKSVFSALAAVVLGQDRRR